MLKCSKCGSELRYRPYNSSEVWNTTNGTDNIRYEISDTALNCKCGHKSKVIASEEKDIPFLEGSREVKSHVFKNKLSMTGYVSLILVLVFILFLLNLLIFLPCYLIYFVIFHFTKNEIGALYVAILMGLIISDYVMPRIGDYSFEIIGFFLGKYKKYAMSHFFRFALFLIMTLVGFF